MSRMYILQVVVLTRFQRRRKKVQIGTCESIDDLLKRRGLKDFNHRQHVNHFQVIFF